MQDPPQQNKEFDYHHGIIDNNFLGTIKTVFKNISQSPITLQKGKSYAQIVLHKTLVPSLINQPFTFSSTRQDKEFGSSLYNIKLELSTNPIDILNIPTNISNINGMTCYHNNDITDEDIHTLFHYTDSTTDSDTELTKSALEFVNKHFSFPTQPDPKKQLNLQEKCIQEYLDLQCNKLGIISADFIINNNLDKQNFSFLQQSDEFFQLPIEHLKTNKTVKKL